MSLDKTLTDQYRLPLKLDKYPVVENLPAHFETIYPKFLEFIESYYDEYDGVGSPAELLNELQHNRDMADVTPQLLELIGEELFQGKDYIQSFLDQPTAIQISNLLYRSKGTAFSIEQFFKMFFGFDVDVNYGRNEIFTVGDPIQEKLLFKSEYRSIGKDASGKDVSILYPGDKLKFNFGDGAIQVYALGQKPLREQVESLYIRDGVFAALDYIDDDAAGELYIYKTAIKVTYNFFYLLRENIDYIVDYDNKNIAFLKPGIENSVKPGDPWLDYLAVNGEISPPSAELDSDGTPFGPLRNAYARLEVTRNFPAGSPIGADVGDKRITDNGYYQMFSLLIKTPISVSSWKDVYKDFVHPSGMFLGGEVLLEGIGTLSLSGIPTSTERYDLDYEGLGIIDDFAYAEVTELNVREPVVKPPPSGLVFEMTDGDLVLTETWEGEENATMSLYFNRRHMAAEDQWLLSATAGGVKQGLVFPAATPNRLMYRYVDNNLATVDLFAIDDVLLGKNYSVGVLVTSTQIFISSDGINSIYPASAEYYPLLDAIGDNFYGSIWEVVLQDQIIRENVSQYPMREGSGDIFNAYQDNNQPFPSRNIAVPSSDRGSWSDPLISLWKGNNIAIPQWVSTSASGFDIKLNIKISTFSSTDTLLLWGSNNENVGLIVTSDHKLEYIYATSGGTTTVDIAELEVDQDLYIQIQHAADSVIITTLKNQISRSTIVSPVAPTEVVQVDNIIGSGLVAAVWNMELQDGVNSRYYPMQDGSGITMISYDQDGIVMGASGDADLFGAGVWFAKNFLTSGEE